MATSWWIILAIALCRSVYSVLESTLHPAEICWIVSDVEWHNLHLSFISWFSIYLWKFLVGITWSCILYYYYYWTIYIFLKFFNTWHTKILVSLDFYDWGRLSLCNGALHLYPIIWKCNNENCGGGQTDRRMDTNDETIYSLLLRNTS
jgi:hypothetical protein